MAVRQEPNEPLGLLIKPASGDCNLACQYCFYLRSSDVYPEQKKHRMSEKVLEEMIKQTLEINHPVASFAWQGGEPLLMGLEFFGKEKVAAFSHVNFSPLSRFISSALFGTGFLSSRSFSASSYGKVIL